MQGQQRRQERDRKKSQPVPRKKPNSSIKMASDSPRRTTSPSSSSSSPISRLQHIANHMAPTTITSFPPEVVPQAPEDPLFGLMRAYKADSSPDKVDLVRRSSPRTPPRQLLTGHFCRASVRIVTTTQNPGSYRWSRRYAVSEPHTTHSTPKYTSQAASGQPGDALAAAALPHPSIYPPRHLRLSQLSLPLPRATRQAAS